MIKLQAKLGKKSADYDNKQVNWQY